MKNKLLSLVLTLSLLGTNLPVQAAETLQPLPLGGQTSQIGISTVNGTAAVSANLPNDPTVDFISPSALSPVVPEKFVGIEPGATVSGVVEIKPNLALLPLIKKVAYYLDGAKSGKVYQSPFIWGGTSGDGTKGFDTTAIEDGDHTLAMVYTDKTGDHEIQINFNVKNTIDHVLVWNREALEAVKQSTYRPPIVSRQLAIMHTAVFDAVNLAQGKLPVMSTGIVPEAGASAEAAAAAAAHYALSQDYPNLVEKFDATLAAALASVKDATARENGRKLGVEVAKNIIEIRSTDGNDALSDYVPSGVMGDWEKTLPNFEEPAMPHWGDMTPFAIADLKAMYPDGPPAFHEQEWVDSYNEVKSYGADFHKVAPGEAMKEETHIALFWADGIGTYGPPGHWNLMALDVAKDKNMSLYESARLFAMLNMAIADACITTWGVKYKFDNWRPITAIRNGDHDGNELTVADPNWTPLVDTPPFPDYVSGHSSFGGAAAAVLTHFFGDDVAFTTSSFGQAVNIEVGEFKPTRSFTSFEQAAKETSISRIYGGIHFRFADIDGVATGKKVGTEVVKTFNNESIAGIGDYQTVRGTVRIGPSPDLIPNIRKVFYYLNGTQAGREYEAPFTWGGSAGFNTAALPNGKYELTMVVTDATGEHVLPVNFIVENK